MMLINTVNPNEKQKFNNPLKKLHDFMEYNKRFPFYPAIDGKDGKECFCIRKKGVDRVVNGSKEFIGEFGGINLAFLELKKKYNYLAISEQLIKIMEE